MELKEGDSFYEVFEFYETVNKLTVTEICTTRDGFTFYKCIKENNGFEDVQNSIFTLRLEYGYYFLNYEEAVAEYNSRIIDVKINKLQKKIDKLEARKIKL